MKSYHSFLSLCVPKYRERTNMFKVIVVCSLVVFANAGLLPDPHAYEVQDVHAPAHYDFSYSVHDGHTGDVKEQQESRRGDAVQGSYSLVEPDGHKRIVHYAADAHSGFNAVVQREGTVHQQPIAQIAHAQPVAYAQAAQPVAYAQVAHATPALAVSHAPVAVAHSAPTLAVSHAPLAVAHSAPALAVSHGPVAVAHSAPAVAVSHQSISTPVIAQQSYAQQAYAAPQIVSHQVAAPQIVSHQVAAPQIVSHQIAAPAYQAAYAQPLGYASQGYANQGYAGQGLGLGLAASHSGYSTVSQVTHHGGYHH